MASLQADHWVTVQQGFNRNVYIDVTTNEECHWRILWLPWSGSFHNNVSIYILAGELQIKSPVDTEYTIRVG